MEAEGCPCELLRVRPGIEVSSNWPDVGYSPSLPKAIQLLIQVLQGRPRTSKSTTTRVSCFLYVDIAWAVASIFEPVNFCVLFCVCEAGVNLCRRPIQNVVYGKFAWVCSRRGRLIRICSSIVGFPMRSMPCVQVWRRGIIRWH